MSVAKRTSRQSEEKLMMKDRTGTRRFLGLILLLVIPLAAACSHTSENAPASAPEDEISLGYGSESREKSTASAASLNERQLRQRNPQNLAEILSTMAGVDVVEVGGGSYSVRIRGMRSLTRNNEPLFVLDGNIIPSTDLITTKTIRRIDVLKDPASLAVYGSRGANGVIVITTMHAH
jgi:TonB-dependent SusC/RagA subfamily outer membrane receptor